MKIILALGANQGDPQRCFKDVIREVQTHIGKVLARSSWIETPAVLHPSNPDPQPNYLNGAILVSTPLSPIEGMSQIEQIEDRLGRIRVPGVIWSPRIIDLDFIAAEEIVLNTERLRLPHPEMHKREFVLGPIEEIAPEWRHPLLRKTVSELRRALKDRSSEP